MNLVVIPEPELEFGSANRHIDVRFGLANYGPVDVERMKGRKLSVGIVGTSESIEGLRTWLEGIDGGVRAKESKYPNLFPAFPGVSGDGAFRCSFEFDSRWERVLSKRQVQELCSKGLSSTEHAEAFVDLIMEEVRYLGEVASPPLVTLVAMPIEAASAKATPQNADDDEERDSGSVPTGKAGGVDLHDLLKARAMGASRVLQVVWPHTYDPSKARAMKRDPQKPKSIQDEATRAWNLSTALYYKAGGTPWRLTRRRTDLTSLHVGVSFFRSRDGQHLHTSLAQVFDERGDGTIVRGGLAYVDKEDRQPHLDSDTARKLLLLGLKNYRKEHYTLPARVVIHKSSTFSPQEVAGFRAATDEERIGVLDLVSIGRPEARLFRYGTFPPLRGSFLSLEPRKHVLYTRGSVDFFSMYPGMYIPRPLGITCEEIEDTPRSIAEEILALSKMNWNNTQFDGRLPITLRAAKQVSAILRYLQPEDPVKSDYRYYM